MARKRLTSTQFTTWAEVDDALRQIGEIDRDLMLIEGDANHAIDELKAQAKADAEPLQARKATLELQMQQFCESNRAEFGKLRTRTMTFGSVGFRLSSKVVIKKIADTLAVLKEFGLHHCIRTKEEPDKEAMKNLPTEMLAAVGASLRTEDAFGYEVHRAEIKEAA